MTDIKIQILCSSDVTVEPEAVGIPNEVCKDAKSLVAYLKDSFRDKKEFLDDFDMLYDMDVQIGVTRIGDENPDQMTLDGKPAILPPQHTYADWS